MYVCNKKYKNLICKSIVKIIIIIARKDFCAENRLGEVIKHSPINQGCRLDSYTAQIFVFCV
jgi:hypothetical protein